MGWRTRRRFVPRRTPTPSAPRLPHVDSGKALDLLHDFDSAEDFADHAADLPHPYGNEEISEWIFGPAGTLTETRRLLAAGIMTNETRKRYEDIRNEIETAMTATAMDRTLRRRTVWSDAGDDIDTDRMNQDHEKPWRTTRIGRAAPVIRIGWNMAISGCNGSSEYAELAARACAIADALATAGIGVEIVALFACRYSAGSYDRGGYVYRIVLKHADEPVDVERIGSFGIQGTQRDMAFRCYHADMPGNGWNGACSIGWTPEEKAAAGVDYVVSRYWSGSEQKTLMEACRITSEEAAA